MSNVTFRRIHGHIVPIKLSKEAQGHVSKVSKANVVSGAAIGVGLAAQREIGIHAVRTVLGGKGLTPALKGWAKVGGIATITTLGASTVGLYHAIKASKEVKKLPTGQKIKMAVKDYAQTLGTIGAVYGGYHGLIHAGMKYGSYVNAKNAASAAKKAVKIAGFLIGTK